MTFKPFSLTIHVLTWMLLLLIPYFSTYQVLKSFIPESSSMPLVPILVLSIIMIVIFYFNLYILIPRYLLLKKYWLYFSFLLIGILTAAMLSGVIFYLSDFNPNNLVHSNPTLEKISPVIRTNAFLMLTISIITSIVLAMNNRLKETEKERLAAQLASLKSQINPHFLFNTLNNIYAQTLDSSPVAADMVSKLSEMMRYTMKDTQQDFAALDEEINYILNYIELQKLRLDERVSLEYTIPEHTPDLNIAPMMLIPFIENAFKYGVNTEQDSRINIQLSLKGSELHLHVVNNKVFVQQDISEKSGLGIENTKLRLNLMYPGAHLLVIEDSEKEFSVSLHIHLK